MSAIPVGSVFVKLPNYLNPVTGIMTQTIPKLNVGEPDTYSEFAGVTVRDQEVSGPDGVVLGLQNTGIGLAQVSGPVKAGDSVGIKQDFDTLAGKPDVPVGVVLQDVGGAVDDPDTKLVRVHFGLAAPASGELETFKVVLKDGDGNPLPPSGFPKIQMDYLECVTWDQPTQTIGSSAVYIARPHELWGSITQEIKDGVTISYTYPGASWPTMSAPDWLHRTCTATGYDSEAGMVTPQWYDGCIIKAAKIKGGTGITASGGASVDYMEVSGREWARPPIT